MRSPRPALFSAIAILSLLVAPGAARPFPCDDDPAKKRPDALAWLVAQLRDETVSVVLWRMKGHEGDRWKDRGVDPSVPHHRLELSADDRAKLVGLATAKMLKERDVDLLGHSFLVELYRAEEPIARLDLHTEGMGESCIFLIDYSDEHLEEGSAVLAFEGTGRKDWLAALAALWDAAAGD